MTSTTPHHANDAVKTPGRYHAVAMSLHWLIAILIFGGFCLGVFMHELPASAEKLQYYSWHKWAGVTVFLLALLRAGWRMTHPAPPLLAGARWEHVAAHGAHVALYLLMLAIPLSGWLHSSAAGYQTVYFGVLPIPDLIGKDKALSELLGEIHEVLNFLMLGVLLLHAGAALQHHWLRRDEVLRRMLPGSGGAAMPLLATAFTAVAFAGVAAVFVAEDEGESATATADVATSPEATAGAAVLAGDLTAVFRQMNVPVEGRFTRFSATTLVFDAAAPEQSRADIRVDTASFDLGDEDYNAEVRKKEWFDTATAPEARFVSDRVQRLADGRYQADGTLTIKNIAQPTTVVFSVGDDAGRTVYSGEATLSRAAFQIGDAEWNDVLDDAVLVRFKLTVPAP